MNENAVRVDAKSVFLVGVGISSSRMRSLRTGVANSKEMGTGILAVGDRCELDVDV